MVFFRALILALYSSLWFSSFFRSPLTVPIKSLLACLTAISSVSQRRQLLLWEHFSMIKPDWGGFSTFFLWGLTTFFIWGLTAFFMRFYHTCLRRSGHTCFRRYDHNSLKRLDHNCLKRSDHSWSWFYPKELKDKEDQSPSPPPLLCYCFNCWIYFQLFPHQIH